MLVLYYVLFNVLGPRPVIHTPHILSLHGFIAIQSWALCQLIPIMVERFIPDGDEHWANYSLMLEITDYLMAPQLCEDDIGYLN